MNILVAEDDPNIRALLEEIINSLGKYKIVASGGAALDAFENAWQAGLPYDAILLDINMPDISGIEVLKNIRHLEKKKGVSEKMPAQIIMMTAISDKATVIACLESGCNDYIVKPFKPVAIVDKLKSLESYIGKN